MLSQKDYFSFGDSSVFLSKKDKIRLEKTRGTINLVSTVCPDYPNDGRLFTFSGKLGSKASLSARLHLRTVPALILSLQEKGIKADWRILVADLPELTASQEEFYLRVAGSREEYLRRCSESAMAIRKELPIEATVETFSEFYEARRIDYLPLQEKTSARILAESECSGFNSRFTSFMAARAILAEKFRGRALSLEELKEAAAHGMSLYATHGTLLRKIFQGKNTLVVNHETPSLKNFFLSDFVSGYEEVKNLPKFSIGIIKQSFY